MSRDIRYSGCRINGIRGSGLLRQQTKGAGRALLLSLALLALALMWPAAANPPSDIALTYDGSNQTLNVTIVHDIGSADPSRHFVREVEVKQNGVEVHKEEYTSQPGLRQFSYLYNISAVAGDEIEVEAKCSIFGSREVKLRVR